MTIEPLTDEEIYRIENRERLESTAPDGHEVLALCKQAREANWLREQLRKLTSAPNR